MVPWRPAFLTGDFSVNRVFTPRLRGSLVWGKGERPGAGYKESPCF
jgi:hypothetical protein